MSIKFKSNALTSGKPVLTEKQRVALGGNAYTPRVHGPGAALPRDMDNMHSVYEPPKWTTRTGR
jgi:hypothetical protein